MPKNSQAFSNGTVCDLTTFEIDLDKAILDIFQKNESKWKAVVQSGIPIGSSAIHLKDTITTQIKEENGETVLIIHAGKKYYIAHFIEFGTIKQGGQPFMRPAFNKIQKEFEQEIKNIDFNKYLKI